ncbi:MAG TPA: YggT family protein [Caulobacteraceae bacterium]|jgi:YggT family protein|nr:YggT family protein [Caulobacteraceae bacterium]
MEVILYPALSLLSWVIQIYIFIIIAMVIMSWLTAFNVVNPRNQFVVQVDRILLALTNPVLNPVRRILPAMGGLDISPMIVGFVLAALLQAIALLQRRVLYGV